MNVHTIETIGRDWTRFLRRDRYGLVTSDEANAAWALQSDRKLRRLVDLGDVEGARLRLARLGIEVSHWAVVALVERAQL